MSDRHRIPLFIGFLITMINQVFLASMFLAMVSVYIYPLGCIVRAIGWLILGAKDRASAIASGLAILFLFPLVYLCFLKPELIWRTLSIDKSKVVGFALILWSIYSTIELVNYILLASYTRLFYVSTVSAISIVYVIAKVLTTIKLENLGELYPAVFPLLISALASCIGSLKIHNRND
ncbi:MAG TPA: hypothetical protein ENF53_00270 [Thermoprotei archaeon]|nr:hypothetical protein [Thermoprotei archaeon]